MVASIRFLEPIREITKQSYLQVLKELGQYYWNHNDASQGMHYYDQILLHDEYAESTYWEYLHLLINHGLVSSAKQIGRKMEKMIEGELGVPVKEKLQALFRQFP